MLTDERAVSTVADVSLAILLVVAAMGLLLTVDGTGRDHDPRVTDYTAETIAASTLAASYDLRPAVAASRGLGVDEVYAETDYEQGDLQRVSHGPIATHLAALAVSNVSTDSTTTGPTVAADYQSVVDERLQTRLLGSRFETAVDARWIPIPNASIAGTVSLGQSPPPRADVSTAILTVPSGLPDARETAMSAVSNADDYDVVAEIVAAAVVEGYLPTVETQRALESSGIERELVVYRYERLAALIDGADPDGTELKDNLVPKRADAVAANEYLVARLAASLEARLSTSFGSAMDAARAVSTGEVTITVRTWTT